MKRFSVRATAAAVGASAVMTLGASAASATVVSAPGAPTGLPAGTTISAPLSGAATLARAINPAQYASCSTGSLSAVVGASGGASVGVSSLVLKVGPAPGATTCVNHGLPFLIRNMTSTSYTAASIYAGGASDGALVLTGMSLTAQVTAGGLPGTCAFAAPTATGVMTNADHSVNFVNVPMSSTSGACSSVSPFRFSAKFGPLTVASGPLAGALVEVG